MTKDQPTARRRTVLAQVAIAAALLAVIGASVGLVLGLRTAEGGTNAGNRTGGGGQATVSPPAPAEPPAPEESRTTAPPAPEASRTTEPPDDYGCLDVTEDAAEKRGSPGGLKAALYVRARNGARRIEVWICRDSAGTLFYQGHEGTHRDRGFPANSGRSLFLTEVSEQDGGYVATLRGEDGATTLYQVRPDRVLIDGKPFEVTFKRP